MTSPDQSDAGPLRETAEWNRGEEELRRLNEELARQAVHLKEVNQTVIDSEQRLRLALATGRIGLWVWNSTDVANAGDWSPRLKEIFSLPLETEVTHEIFLARVHPEDRERVNDGVMQALGGAEGGEYRCEYRTVPDEAGAHGWVTARGQAFFDSVGVPVRFIGTVMDITERKRAEETMERYNLELEERIADRTADLAQSNAALQVEIEERKRFEQALSESENYLRQAIETIPTLVWTSLPDGEIEYLNQRWLDYTGLTLEQARGWNWQIAVHPDDLPGLIRYWKSIISAGIAGEYEARLRRADGTFRWFLFRGVPLYDAAGRLTKWYGTNTDIEQMRAADHLARGQMESLTQTMAALSRESEPEKFLEHVLRMIGERLGAHSIGVWEMKPETGRMELMGNCEGGKLRLTVSENGLGLPRSFLAHQPHPIWAEFFRAGNYCVGGELRTGGSRVRALGGKDARWHDWDADAENDPNVMQLVERLIAAGVVGMLAVPMFVAGKVTGFLNIRFRETREFACAEIELVRALAHQAMLALQLMRLSLESRQAAVVAERNRMARDIHDTLAQGFTGVIMQLQAAKGAAAKGELAAAAEHIERAEDLARASLGEARRSVRALRPRSLRDGTLCMALDDLLKRMSSGTDLKAEFSVEGEIRAMPMDWEEGLLRIAQESLTNTLKHAHARHFRATLTFAPEHTRLKLVDDGRGFDPETESEGFGLVGMHERVDRMGGEFLLRSQPGGSTEILVTVNQPAASGPPSENEHAQ